MHAACPGFHPFFSPWSHRAVSLALMVQKPSSHLHCAFGLTTQDLSCLLDSVVHVSRQVNKTLNSPKDPLWMRLKGCCQQFYSDKSWAVDHLLGKGIDRIKGAEVFFKLAIIPYKLLSCSNFFQCQPLRFDRLVKKYLISHEIKEYQRKTEDFLWEMVSSNASL